MRPKAKLLVATGNQDKLREMKAVLNGIPVQILSIGEFPDLPEVEESGATLVENAVQKAREIHDRTGYPALADDTGLEVEALAGKPGVYSSRYAGENASYSENVRKLLEEMKGLPEPQRRARFRTVIAFVNGNHVITTEGIQEGIILSQQRGNNGFGYDPVFYVPEYGQTFAEMPTELKNQISHRGKALRKMRQTLERRFDEVFNEVE